MYRFFEFKNYSGKTIIILKKEYDRASRTETSHKHYIKSIEHVPLWIFINFISFGTCSKMYKNMNPKEQTLISKSLASINDPSMFATFMEYLTNIRNICAHDERLYCYICFMRPPELPLMRYFNLLNKSIKSYFGLVIVVNYSATSYRASCFIHYCLKAQKRTARSYTMSTGV